MSKPNSKEDRNRKIKKIIDLLKFALSTHDDEIIKSSLESAIESLEEDLLNK